MALDAPAPFYPTPYSDNTGYTHDDMASLVASTSTGFTGPNTQQLQHHYQPQQYQQNAPTLSHNSQAHAQAQAQAQQQQPQLSQSLAGVGRRHRTVPAKTFKCTGFGDCAMVFSRSEHLARHVRKHTGERPFACHCSKQFSRLDNLRQHAQTVHADRPELNARMMARLVEVQGTMATLGKAGSSGPSSTQAGPSNSSSAAKPHPPRAMSLSLSLDTGTSSGTHVKSEGGGSPDLAQQHPHPHHLSLQQRKARRGGLALTLSSADIAAANLHAGFHLQGHATAPLPHGYTHHGMSPLGSGPHGQESEYFPAAPHSASAHQTHFPHAAHAFAPSFSLDAALPAHHHAHAHGHRGGRVEYTQSEYGVPSHHAHAHGHPQVHSEYAHGSGSGSPPHEFPFHADMQQVRSQALPSPPYSAASASGYFPSMPQQMLRAQEEVFEHREQQQHHEQAAYSVKQEEMPAYEVPAFSHPAQQQQQQQHQLHHQHSQTWSEPHSHGAYASPPITPHLASFPSLSLGGSTAGSLSPHSAFSASPTIPPSISAFEGSLSPEQQAFESGYVHQQTHEFEQQQHYAAQPEEHFDGGSNKFDQHMEHFDQQQEGYYATSEQQQQFFAAQQQSMERQDRWLAQQQYRREHGFAA